MRKQPITQAITTEGVKYSLRGRSTDDICRESDLFHRQDDRHHMKHREPNLKVKVTPHAALSLRKTHMI